MPSGTSVANFLPQKTNAMRTISQTDLPGEAKPVCPELFQVVIQCDGEQQQRELYEEMQRRGLPCKLLIL